MQLDNRIVSHTVTKSYRLCIQNGCDQQTVLLGVMVRLPS